MNSNKLERNSLKEKIPPRSILRYLIYPNKQLKYAYYHLLLVGLAVLIVNGAAYYKFSTLVLNTTNVQANDMLIDYTQTLGVITLVTMIIMGIFTFLVEIVVLHRFVGPLKPLTRHLQAILDGNYSFRSKLRESDEIQEISDKLNEISELLEKRKAG